MACRLDVKKAILDNAFNEMFEGRYTYSRISDDTVRINGRKDAAQTKALSRGQALKIANQKLAQVKVSFNDGVTGYVSSYSEYDPVTITLNADPNYVEYEYKKLPLDQQTDPKDAMFQLPGTESSKASPKTLKLVKDLLNKIGVSQQSVSSIRVNGLEIGANGVADITQKLVQIAQGKEDVALTEEAMHFVVELLEQKDPALFNKLLSEINSYNMYKSVVAEYASLKEYQTSDGKPDIRKLKKEAIAKVLTETVIKKNEGYTEKPELLAKAESWWQKIINGIRGIFSKSGFDQAAMQVLSGEFEGSVEDLRGDGGVYLQQSKSVQQTIVDNLKAVQARIKRPTTDDGKYTIDGKEINTRVSDLSKTWYDNRFADKDLVKSEFAKAVDDLKMEKGTAGHADFESMMKNHFLDGDGKFIKNEADRPSDAGYVSQINPYDREMYDTLKKNMEERLASFPDDTIFLSETTIYDPKRDLAGTVDFIAVEPSGKTHILDWKFMDINLENKDDPDVPWYKIGAWKTQMKNYKLILKNAYGVTFDGSEQTTMIPIRAEYSKGDSKKKVKPQLLNLYVGKINVKDEERAYLLPVGLEEQKTGDKRIDKLLEQLNNIYETISTRKATPDQKAAKAEQLNELYKAIRQLQVRQNLKPLVNQAKVLNKEIRNIIKDYNENWKTKDVSTFSRAEKNDFANKILAYEKSLTVYTTLYKNLRGLFGDTLTEEEKKLRDDIRDVTDTANELETELSDVRDDFAENIIAKSENVLDFLRPEKIIKGFSKWFGSTSTLQLKSTEVLYKMANRAFGFAAQDTLTEGNILLGIKEKYDKWAASKGLNNKNYFDILKKKDKNELVDEFDPEFYKEARSRIHDKDRQWVKDNIDVAAYTEFLKEQKQRDYESIEKKTRFGNDRDIANEITFEKGKADQLLDISTPESAGWLLYNYAKKFPKREKWESKEWKVLNAKGNEPVLEFYNYIKKRNEQFEKTGYINSRQARTFLPFVRKSLMEKIVMGGELAVGEGLLRAVTVSEGDVGYGQIDPITKQPVYSIPKYFTRDTKEEVSGDLFKNMTLLNEMAIRYEYLNEIEDQLNLIIATESNKDAIKTSYFGKTIYRADGEIETTSDNNENTKLVRDMMEAIVYGHKFIESENFDQLLGGLSDFGKRANDKIGYKIFPEKFTNAQVSLNKSLSWLNNTFQLKALGLNPISALSNFLGGSFQSYINAGTYFTKSQFAKNEFLIAGRMNGVDAKKYIGALEYFLPLTENYNQILAKKLSLSKLSQEGVQDFLMILMRKSDQYVQTVNFFSYLDNTIVENGQLVNAREFLRATPEYANIYNVTGAERKALEAKFEEDVKKLVDEKGVMKLAEVKGDELVIPGIERKSDSVISLRRKVQAVTKDALGNLSEDDLRTINLNVYGKSFMVFKNWIPRLVDVRLGNLKYNSATEAYEWGRSRMVWRVLSEGVIESISNLSSAALGNDEKWVAQMKNLYEKKKTDYLKDTGKELRMTEAEFLDLVNKNIRNQATDVLFYLSLTSLFLLAKALPPDDEDKATQNRYKYMIRVIDKVKDEVGFFYDPTSIIGLTASGIFPSLGYIDNFKKLFTNFGNEMYGMAIGDEKLVDKNQVVKYALKGFPITSQFDAVFLLLFPDLAKDLGMKAQSQAKPFGR